MKVIRPSTPYGWVTFCDDIRQEIGGKVTAVGIYNSYLYYRETPPLHIPKLAMRISYLEEEGESTEPVSVKVIVLQGDEQQIIIEEVLIPDRKNVAEVFDGARKQMETMGIKKDPDSRIALQALKHFEISPFPIFGPCKVVVRAYRGDEEIRLGALSILPGPDVVPPPTPSPPTA